MIRQNRISPRQLRRMIFIETFGQAALSFPAVACRGGLHGFLPILLYVVLLVLMSGWFCWLSKKWEQAAPEENEQGYGFAIKKWAGLLYALRFFINAAALTAFFGQSIQEIYMPNTTVFMILLPFVALIWYTVQTNLQKRARFLELIFPWILAALLLSFLLAFLGIGEAAGLAGAGSLWRGAFSDSLPESMKNAYLLLLCASPLEFLLFLKPAAGENLWTGEAEEKKVTVSLITAIGGSILCNVLFTFLAVRTMGNTLTAGSHFPVVKMLQLIRLPGGFLERFDILPAVFWLLCLAGVVSGYLYYGRAALQRKAWKGTSVRGVCAAVLLLAVSCAAVRFPVILRYYLLYKIWIDFPLSLLLPLMVFSRGKRSRVLPATLLICLLTFLPGCQRLTDVEEKSYVLSLYVDTVSENASPDAGSAGSSAKAAEASGEGQYNFYVARADMSQMQEREERIPCQVTQIQAGSLSELEEKYLNTVPGEIEWNHIYTIFLGAGIAASEKQCLKFLEEWDGAWQKSPNVLLALCSERPEKLYGVEGIPEGAAGQEVSLLAEQAKGSLPENLCETPMDFLQTQYEGAKKIQLYRITLKNDKLVLGTGAVGGV